MTTLLRLTIPESFDPREFLKSPELSGRMDDARYFVDLILTKLSREEDVEGCVHLAGKYLKKIMHQDTYKDVITALRDGGAIERSSYKVGGHSFGYRLTERFAKDKHVRVAVADRRLIRSLLRFYEAHAAKQQALIKPVHATLAQRQEQLSIHGDRAREFLSRNPEFNKFDMQGILIAKIERRDFHTSVGKYGRVSNNITSLSKKVRRLLHVEGEPLGCCDLSCCQPALLARLYELRGKPLCSEEQGRKGAQLCNYDSSLGERINYDSSFGDSENDDFVRYRSLAQRGQLYDFMMGEMPGKNISREEIKQRFVTDILAKKGQYLSEVEKLFRELFPTVYEFVRATNKDGKERSNLIRELQREESKLVIETVAADLVTRFPGVFFLTLHDAIYSTAEHLPKIKEAFDRAFELTGFPMQLKTLPPSLGDD